MKILFLHGWGAKADLYAPILAHLRQKHEVLAPDLPGFGDCPEPPIPWGTDDYVDWLVNYLGGRAGEEWVLIGHSHGGRMILNLMSREKPPIKCEKCVLFDAAGIRPKRPMSYYIKVYSYKIGKKLFANAVKNAGSADYRAASPVMRGTLSKVVNEDYTPRLKNIRAETLLVWGGADTATPLYMAKILESGIANAGLAVFEGASHWAVTEQIGRSCLVLDAFLG